MDCFVDHNTEMMLENTDDSSGIYKCNGNKQSPCQELVEFSGQITQDNTAANHVSNYAILPAVNLCPITWGIGNLEVVETVQNGFIEVDHTVGSSVATPAGRLRKKPRPYSPPDLTAAGNRKSKQSSRVVKMQRINSPNDTYIDKRTGLPFSCDKCKSPHIVDPTRCSPGNRKRPPMPRRYVDPINGRIMLLCNACGIAAKTNRKSRAKKTIHDAETLQRLKEQYITESVHFAKNLSYEYNEPELATLYCPSFNGKGCGCVEKYLSSVVTSSNMIEERQHKALDLLSYHRRARELNKDRRYSNTGANEHRNISSENELHIDECEENFLKDFQKPHYKCKSRDYEKFALASRMKLRSEYALCEKATQKILVYSNNFLHKESKTVPERGPRVEKTMKRTARLKPIVDLHEEYCCGNVCTRIASSHANLLENWRSRASTCQKEARRVIAEMLTPTGGTKANCYRFIKMVTGCCVTTIFLVNEHMRKTKGDREPPEHGLKKYWRRNSKAQKPSTKNRSGNATGLKNSLSELTFVPSEEELFSMGAEAACTLLQAKKQQLEYLQNKLEKAKSKLRSAVEPDTSTSQEIAPEALVNELSQGVQSNLFILGQDGVIRPWKNDSIPFEQIATHGNT